MDAIITYRENLMKSMEKIASINELTKGAEYKINIQKANIFLTMSNQKLNFKIILFILAKIYINCLGINLTKYVQNPYTENDKANIIIKQDLNKQRDIHSVYGLEDAMFIKMPILANLIINSTRYQSIFQQA